MLKSQPQKQREQKMTKRQSTITLIIFGGVVAALTAFAAGAFTSSDDETAESAPRSAADAVKPLPVNVMKVEFVESIQESRTYTGVVRARRRSELAFELSGIVKSIDVDEGDIVTSGDVMARLDTETLLARKRASEASLRQANSQLEELESGPRQEFIRASRAALAAAKSQLDNAVVNLKRRRPLHDVGAISDDEYDQALFAEKTARANFNSAQQQLSELEAGTRSEKIAAQQSAVGQLQAALDEVEVAIGKSQLIAPFDGTVTRRYLDPGSIAGPSMPVVKLVEQEHLEAWIGLPVSIVAKLQKDSRHELVIGDRPVYGTVRAWIGELDPVTRTQTVLFTLDPEAANYVVSGQLCQLSVTSEVASSGFWLPTSALSRGVRGLWSVMVLVPNESGEAFLAQRRDVEVVRTDSDRVLARGTITSGDRIVADGVHRIADGQLVVPAGS